MNISKLYKRIKSYKERDQSKLYINPSREWSIVLFLGTIFSIVTIFFCYGAFNNYYINGFKDNNVDLVETDPYNIEDLKNELSQTLKYYKEREDEHKALLEKQPILENKIIIKSSNASETQERVEELSNSENNEVSVPTKTLSEESLIEEGPVSVKDGPVSKVFDNIQSNISNVASVLKAFFIDPNR